MKYRFFTNSYCFITVAIFLIFQTNNSQAQSFVSTDSTFSVGFLSSSFGPDVSTALDNIWELNTQLHVFVKLPISQYSSIRVGALSMRYQTNSDAKTAAENFDSYSLYGTIIPFEVEWVPKVILNTEFGVGLSQIDPENDLLEVAPGSETEIIAVAGFQIYTTALGRIQPVVSAQYFRVFSYLEYDFTQLSIGVKYSFHPPKRIKKWWRAGS